jgi:membrane-bound ClpP family serine protease
MPRGSKKSYSSKQKRMASHIEKSAKRKGRSTKTAERIAWASVNKQTGGAAKKRSSHKKAHK